MKSLRARFIPANGIVHDNPDSPLPAHIFVPYVRFWHIVTTLIYLAYAVGTIWQQRAALDWRVAVVTTLLAAQLGVYLRLYVFAQRWPLPLWQHAIYFGGGLVAWLIQSHLFEHFFGLNDGGAIVRASDATARHRHCCDDSAADDAPIGRLAHPEP